MTRVNGRRPEPQKIEFINDWSKLKEALGVLRRQRDTKPMTLALGTAQQYQALLVDTNTMDDLLHYVPALLDAYSELWELTGNLMRAVEAQKENQDSLYVPDAREMVENLGGKEGWSR